MGSMLAAAAAAAAAGCGGDGAAAVGVAAEAYRVHADHGHPVGQRRPLTTTPALAHHISPDPLQLISVEQCLHRCRIAALQKPGCVAVSGFFVCSLTRRGLRGHRGHEQEELAAAVCEGAADLPELRGVLSKEIVCSSCAHCCAHRIAKVEKGAAVARYLWMCLGRN